MASIWTCLATSWPCHGRAWTVSWPDMASHGHRFLNSSWLRVQDMAPGRFEGSCVIYRMRKNSVADSSVSFQVEQPRGGEGPQVGDHQIQIGEPKTVRRLGNFSPSFWGDGFTSFNLDTQLLERYSKEVEELKEEVKKMVGDGGAGKPEEKMVLIDTLERLGVSYLFEKEIEEQLEHMFANYEEYSHVFQDNLFMVSLHFRVFRQHGYNLSSSVFRNFKDTNGDFKEAISNDVKGMLCLYEATHIKTHEEGEDILDEAFSFTKARLESLKPHLLTPDVDEQVTHALFQSLQRGIPRVEARHYISLYENDASRNDMLLRLAKIDFNRLQLLYKEELSQISRWWKDLDLRSHVPYARDRAVELYLCGIATYFEPQYALARLIHTKTMIFISYVDDTYDAYGTYEELKHFTNAVQRDDLHEIDQLPKYMKKVYTVVQNFFDETEEEMAKQERAYGVRYLREAFKEIVRCYDKETEWLNKAQVPTFDEYLSNAIVSVTAPFILTASFIGMGEVATTEAFQWLQSKPKIVTAYSTIARLLNDIGTHEVEEKKGHVATGVECYMRQHGVSKSEAIGEIYKIVENAWKDINEEMMRPNPVSKDLLMRVLNLARIPDVFYKDDDAYTHPGRVREFVIALFEDPIPI